MKFLISWLFLVTVQVLFLGRMVLPQVHEYLERYASAGTILFLVCIIFALLHIFVSISAFLGQRRWLGTFFIITASVSVFYSLFVLSF